MASIDASIYNSKTLNAYASGAETLYSRDASIPMNSSLQNASLLGTLIKNETQLVASSGLSRANSQQFYKFSLSSNSLKLGLTPGSGAATARVQILNSSGKVIADSSTFASSALQDAYKNVTSEKGMDTKSGDYFVKVTYDVTSSRSDKLAYTLALYSGTRFSTSYKTIAKPQTASTQALLTDKTMTFSTIDALSYGTKDSHTANATIASAVNIGWLYQNKSALGAKSRLTDVCTNEFYTFTLQKGNNLKIAVNNRTNTQDLRVQVMDPTGYIVIADSHGNEKQKAAYASLNTTEGMKAKPANYVIKVSYADPGPKQIQVYDFKVFSGDSYSSYYETTAATETMSNALYSGHLSTGFSTASVLAAYLQNEAEGNEVNLFDTLSQYV